ncbi:MAG: hypothetical protein AB1717_03005 [Pseudomonadota bacterium]
MGEYIITEWDEDEEDFVPVIPEDEEEAMKVVNLLAPLPPMNHEIPKDS